MSNKTLENKVRRDLARYGYSLRKSRSRYSIDNQGCYMVINAYENRIVLGEHYDVKLEEILAWLSDT